MALGSLACAGPEGASQPAVQKPDLTIAAAVGDTELFDITLELGIAFCSTAVGCPTELHGEAVPSLVTGATCSMPDAWDGFLLYARRLTCYASGAPGTPSTWSDPTVVSAPATTTEERAYSAVMAAIDTQYVNSSQYLDPLEAGSPALCFYEAEALIAPTALDANPRAVYHRQHPARMTWDVVIEPGAASDACNFASPALSGVDVDYPASLTVSKPTNTTKGSYPATVDYATVDAITLNDGADFGAARIRYVLGATTPVAPSAVSGFAERNLWISDGTNGIDAVIDSTCVRVDSSTGALVSIGLLLRGGSSGDLLGAIEVLSTNGLDRFECTRAGDGACTYLPYTTEPGGQPLCTELITRCHDVTKNFDETDVDCGGSCGGCAVGLACATDGDCLSGYCDGASHECVAAASCLALVTARSGTPNGRYEIDPDGAGGDDPFLAYCDMTGGGWTLVMKLSTNTTALTHGASAWTTSALLAAGNPHPNVNLLNASNAKYEAYNTVSGTTLRLDWLEPEGVSWAHTFGSATTALTVFSGSSVLVGGDESVATCHGTLLASVENYSASAMAFAQGSQFYGFNGAGLGSATSRVRWGFGSNDEVLGNPVIGEVWEPEVGIGATTASIFWLTHTDCDACSCYGSGTANHTTTAGNLWIK
ncbi:MAG: hypothetical protein CVU56_22195 [Deltaproteobacteria bacterium HGW-Deltaproteobacteria-14]|jgi:hypothetical protein|nr:MAG: hypothetical protein CVU56_22195 [Deltaproteobacteria bacterium HGW-Deltaproteobacteria-14]